MRVKMMVLAGMVLVAGMAQAAAKPRKVKGPDLPGIWQEATAQQRLLALRAAEVDAMRLLAERIYGFQLSAGTMVYDLTRVSDRARNAMLAELKGATEQRNQREYTKDGIVQVVYAVNMRKVIETISRNLEGGTEKIDKRLLNEDRLIDVMGNAALPGSPGALMVGAKRAAELDAYRRMAGRVLGVKVDSKTTVKDMCLRDDRMQATICAFIKGMVPVDIAYEEDGTCEVTMQLKKRQVIETVETITRTYREGLVVKSDTIRNVNRDINDQTFRVTGTGAPRVDVPTEADVRGEPRLLPDDVLKEEREVIRRVISDKVVVE